uniref:Uncharacterized protein n=1 Tax=Arundo donax TaxID=35708 RepID=A0A0A8Y5A9_ARUDO
MAMAGNHLRSRLRRRALSRWPFWVMREWSAQIWRLS